MEDAVETIHARRSVRRFDPAALSSESTERIEPILADESAPGPFGSAPRFALVSAEQMAASGRIGTYGVIRDAPAFVVGAVADSERAMEDYGYRMEGIVLEATASGLGTCWLGGTFKRSSAADLIGLREHELIPAVTPIGHPSDRGSLIGGAIRLAARSSTRLPFERLFFDRSFDRPLAEDAAEKWREVLECVRLGPSASNKQPWRIVLERRDGGDRLHLFFAEDRAYNSRLAPVRIQNIDVGIAMRHVVEATATLGLAGSWDRLSEPPPAQASGGPVYIATFSCAV